MLNPLLINYEESKMSVCFSVKSYILDWLELSSKVWDWQCGKLYYHTCKSSDYWMPISDSFFSSLSGRFKQDGIQSPTRQRLGYVSSKTTCLVKFWFSFTGVAALCFCRYMYMYKHTCVSRTLNFSVKVCQSLDFWKA